MCTYNGGAFLRLQLESILAQSRLPDHLLILDDGSTDDTVWLARQFAASAPFPVRVEENPSTLGFVGNFERALSIVEGDVIVLADQDDVWLPEKLHSIEVAFSGDPELGMIFSDAVVVDRELRPLGFHLWKAMRFSEERQRRVERGDLFEVLLSSSVVTGATCAIHSRLRPTILPFRSFAHDAWIALVASAVTKTALLREPMILYRQHGGNQIGVEKRGFIDRVKRALMLRQADFVLQLELLTELRQRLASLGDPLPGRRESLEEAIEHFSGRVRLGELDRLSRLPVIAGELRRGRYTRFGNGWRTALRDFLV